MRSDERDKNDKRDGMMGIAKGAVHLPFVPFMLPSLLPSLLVSQVDPYGEREKHTGGVD